MTCTQQGDAKPKEVECLPLSERNVTFAERMLTEYLRAALGQAHYELLGEGEGFYGEIPKLQGVYAQAETLEACREELAGTLEDWLLFRISRQLPIPAVAGIDPSISA